VVSSSVEIRVNMQLFLLVVVSPISGRAGKVLAKVTTIVAIIK
jgi:hypothetical protein